MTKLARCPCGDTPTHLNCFYISARKEWVNAFCSCCNDFSILLNSDNHALDSDEFKEKVAEAWKQASFGYPVGKVDG